LVVDLHGQSHDRRHQLGYVLNQADLEGHTDAQLDASKALRDKCSLRAAVALPSHRHAAVDDSAATAAGVPRNNGAPLSSLVRGARSLGALLESLGHPCVPSPTSPHAHLPPHGKKLTYFNGGYNTCVHGSNLMGVAQREKERAAAAIASASAAGATASVHPAATPTDPDPSFSALFTSTLEAECFVSVQIESAYEDNRDSDAHMQRFAHNLAQALCTFTQWHVLADGEAWPSTCKQG
jgi:hypothetical protein